MLARSKPIQIFLFLLLSIGNVRAELLDRLDLAYYRPQANGISDLVFDMRISGLTDELNAREVFGKLKDIFFRVYYTSSKPLLVEVFGMPKGFRQVKDEIINLARLRTDFVLPVALSDRLKNFKFKEVSSTTGIKKYEGMDPNYRDDITRVTLSVTPQYSIKELAIFRPTGIERSRFHMKKFPWSKGKVALDNFDVETRHGHQVMKSFYQFEYSLESGYGFPKKITINNEMMLQKPVSKSPDLYPRNLSTTITFSNYKVNTGEAEKILRLR